MPGWDPSSHGRRDRPLQRLLWAVLRASGGGTSQEGSRGLTPRDEVADSARSWEDARTQRGVPVSLRTPGGCGSHSRRQRARGEQGLQAPRAGRPRTSPEHQRSASWKRWNLGGKRCGVGSRPGRPAGAPCSLSLPGPRGRAAGRAAVALTYWRAAEGWGWGSAPRSLSPSPGVSAGSTARSCSCSGDCGGDCAGASRGCARRMLGRGRRPGAAQNPLSSPRPALPFPGAAPAPWPRTRGARESHGTRCLPGVGSGRQ